MRGSLTGDKAIHTLCLLKEGREFEFSLTPENGNYVFQQACIEAFTESADPKNAKRPLGLIAQRIVELLTDPDYFPDMEEGFELIQSLPLLNVYGDIEEMFLKLSRDAWEIDAFRGGDWPMLLRAMTIPASDEVFSVRNYDVLPMASAHVGKRIFQKIEDFRHIKRLYPNL